MNFAANPQDLIYHEKQEGRLCAVHCLNNLLQGSYFTAVDLGNLADQLDEAELQQMAEGGFDGEDYRRFVASPSSNKDDTGYFSLQVIQKALSNLTIEMIKFNSKSSNLAISLRANPTAAQAFICHYQDHWYALRKFGTQWINLNSVLSKPKPISDTYLSLFLEQLQTEGHSIYIIAGNLIQTEADQYLLENPLPDWYSKEEPPKSSRRLPAGDAGCSGGGHSSLPLLPPPSYDEAMVESALAASLYESAQDEERQMKLAIEMSLKKST